MLEQLRGRGHILNVFIIIHLLILLTALVHLCHTDHSMCVEFQHWCKSLCISSVLVLSHAAGGVRGIKVRVRLGQVSLLISDSLHIRNAKTYTCWF